MSASTDLSPAGTEPDPRESFERRARRVQRRAEAARRAKRRRRRRRVLLTVVALLVVAAGWLSYRAYQIKSSLDAARGVLLQARSQLLEGSEDAGAVVAEAQADTQQALSAGSDPVWSIVAHIPVLGTSFRNATALTQVSDDLARGAFPVLVNAATDLARLHGASPKRLPVGALEDLAGPLSVVDNHLQADAYALTHLTTPGELAPVNDARVQLLVALRSLQSDVHTAAVAAQVAPGMLGGDGPRHYLVAFENPAEARPDGGNLGAYAELVASHGHLRVVRLGPNTDLPTLKSPPRSLDAGFRASYGPYGAGQNWVSTNLSPDFAADADAWAAMYTKGTGEKIDGVVGLDPTALGDLAAVTRDAVTIPGYGVVKPQDLAGFIESREYVAPLSRRQRQDAVAAAGRQILHRLLSADLPARPVLKLLARDAGEGHVHLASVRADEQTAISAFPIAGTVPSTTRPYAGVFVTNAAGSKLDYYLHERMSYQAPTCRSSGVGAITVRLTNEAPTHGLPAYVTLRDDRPVPKPPVGQNRDAITVLGTQDGQWSRGSVNGHPIGLPGTAAATKPGAVPAVAGNVAGHPALTIYLEMPLHRTQTVQLHMRQHSSAGSPLVQHQALSTPVTATASGGC